MVGRTLRSDGGPSLGRPQKSAPPDRRRLPDDDRAPEDWAWPEPDWRALVPERRLRLLPPPPAPPPPAWPGVRGFPPEAITLPPRRRHSRPGRPLRRWRRAAGRGRSAAP